MIAAAAAAAMMTMKTLTTIFLTKKILAIMLTVITKTIGG
jgi:hypothetical protein